MTSWHPCHVNWKQQLVKEQKQNSFFTILFTKCIKTLYNTSSQWGSVIMPVHAVYTFTAISLLGNFSVHWSTALTTKRIGKKILKWLPPKSHSLKLIVEIWSNQHFLNMQVFFLNNKPIYPLLNLSKVSSLKNWFESINIHFSLYSA